MNGCRINNSVVINALGAIISSEHDESIEGLTFVANKNIEILPENIAAKFPNLKAMDAAYCEAFQNLNKMKTVELQANNCINRVFRETTIINLQQSANEHYGYGEATTTVSTPVKVEMEIEVQDRCKVLELSLEHLTLAIAIITKQLEKKELEIERLMDKIEFLQMRKYN
jgi:hypothetical protein